MRSPTGATARRPTLRRLAAIAPVVAIVGMLAGANPAAADGTITLVAGQYYSGCLDLEVPSDPPTGAATTAKFGYRTDGVAVSTLGDRLFIANLGGGRLDQVTLSASPPTIKALATGVAPRGVAVDPRSSATVYFVETISNEVVLRRVDAVSGAVSLVANLGPPASGGSIADNSMALAADGAGNVYVAIQGTGENAGIHVVDTNGGPPTKISTSPIIPYALAVGGSSLFVTEMGTGPFGTASGKLVRIDNPGSGAPAAAVRSGLFSPNGVALSPSGRLFLAEGGRQTVTELDPATLQNIQLVAGTDKTPGSSGDGDLGTNAKLQSTLRLAADLDNNVYILDGDNCVVRKVREMPEKVPDTETTVAGNTNTTVGTDTTLPRTTDPTLPSGQVRDVPETQISPESQVQPQAEPDPGLAADVDPGPVADFDGSRGDALLGSEFTNPGSSAQFDGAFDGAFDGVFDATFGGNFAGSTGGVAVDPGAAGGGAVVEPVAPVPPPAPGFSPPALSPGAAPPALGAMSAESPSSRGVPRYAMVAHDGPAGVGLRPVATAVACGIIGLFGSCLIAAMGAGGAREARRAPVRARPRRAH